MDAFWKLSFEKNKMILKRPFQSFCPLSRSYGSDTLTLRVAQVAKPLWVVRLENDSSNWSHSASDQYYEASDFFWGVFYSNFEALKI